MFICNGDDSDEDVAWGRMGLAGAGDWPAEAMQNEPMTTVASRSLRRLRRLWRGEVIGEFGPVGLAA